MIYAYNGFKGDNMKNTKLPSYLRLGLALLTLLLTVIAFCIPAFVVSSGGADSPIYFFGFLNESGSTVGASFFDDLSCLFICIFLVVGSFFLTFLKEKTPLNYVGYAFLLSASTWVFARHAELSYYLAMLEDSMSSAFSYTMGGLNCLVAASTFAILLILTDVFFLYGYEKVEAYIQKKQKPILTVEEKLARLNSMHEQGLITEEEYAYLRKETLDEMVTK